MVHARGCRERNVKWRSRPLAKSGLPAPASGSKLRLAVAFPRTWGCHRIWRGTPPGRNARLAAQLVASRLVMHDKGYSNP